MLAPELKSQINKLWDRFWAGGIANPLTAIEQISYLIFMKRLEDLDNVDKKRAEARGEKYESVFDGVLEANGFKVSKSECRWSHWKHFNAEDMIVHVRDKVFPFLKSIRKGNDGEFSKQMQEAVFMIPKPSLLQEAVKIVDDLNITARNQDTQGDIYEYLLSELNQAGKAGQFRTPRHIIRMMVEIVNPQLGEKIADPACGTAGFLVNAYQYILKVNTSKDLIKYDEEGVAHNLIGDKIVDKKHWNLLKQNSLYGYDFDATMARIASMNMILHGIEHPNIIRFDTLSKAFEQKGDYDVVLANPPFKGSIDVGDIHDNFKLQTTKTELLFLELFYNLLNVGGRCAVIVPNGVLFGSSNAYLQVRKLLLEKCQMEAVISMPSGVFKPYSGVGTAVLVFTKGGKTENVWFYDMKSDGFSLDDKRDLIDGKGDIPDIVNKYKTKMESSTSFLVAFEEIKNMNYDLLLSSYQKVKFVQREFEEPEAIVNQILEVEKEIANELSRLKNIKMETPKDWEWKSLGDVCEVNDRDHRTPRYLESGIPLISPKDFTESGVNFNAPKYVSKEELENFVRKCRPELGDILYSRIGTIGEAREIEFKEDFVALHSIAVIKPNRHKILPGYLLYLLRSDIVRRQAKKGTKSIGTPDLGLKEIKKFKIPLPPIEIQREIADIFEKVEQIKRKQGKAAVGVNTLGDALLQKAFSGELVS